MSLNLAFILDMSARTYPNVVALKLDNYKITYAELSLGVKRVANILKDHGIKRGDKVAMMIPNTPHFPLLYYGILNVGATVVPVNCLLKSHEIQFLPRGLRGRTVLRLERVRGRGIPSLRTNRDVSSPDHHEHTR